MSPVRCPYVHDQAQLRCCRDLGHQGVHLPLSADDDGTAVWIYRDDNGVLSAGAHFDLQPSTFDDNAAMALGAIYELTTDPEALR